MNEPSHQHEKRRKWLVEFIAQPLRQAATERRECLDSAEAGNGRWQAVVVLVVSAFMLTMRDDAYRLDFLVVIDFIHSLGQTYPKVFRRLASQLTAAENLELSRLAFWSLWQFLTYFVIPAAVIKIVFRQRLSDFGLKLRGMSNGWWVYLAMYLAIFPAIMFVSTTQSFQHTYPFYKLTDSEPLWPRFWIWQIFYALQFVSLEFFFRGFMIHGTRHHLGAYSIYVMMIPYCMIHYGKPLPETMGAIVAGIVLGFMSLKTRSIWLGAATHIAVALTMDLAALAQR